MMIIWEYEEPVSRFQVEEKLNVEKKCCTEYHFNIAYSFGKKDLFKSEEREIKSLCTISRKRKLYRHGWKNMLDKMFQGSLAKFASALYDGEKLSSKEVKQLQEFIDRQNRKSGVEGYSYRWHFIIKWNLSIGHSRIYGICCTKNNGEKARSLLEKDSLDTSDT